MAMAIAEDGTRIKYRKILGSDSAVTDAWMNQSQPAGYDHSGGIFFFEGDTIYSYGHHFPMAIRMVREDGLVWYLINGDTRSNTTSRHQSAVRQAVTGSGHPAFGGSSRRNEYVIVPFSALARAGIKPRDIDPIDSEGEWTWTEMRREKVLRKVNRTREIRSGYEMKDGSYTWVTYTPPKIEEYTAHEWTGEWKEEPHEFHLMGSTLFKAEYREEVRDKMPVGHHCGDCCWSDAATCDSRRRTIGGGYDNHVHHRTVTGTAYYISGLDSTSRNPWDSFFLTRLDLDYWTTHYSAEPPQTVSDAYRAMRSVYVDDLVREPVTRDLVKRQGDWFFVPEGATKVAADLNRLDRKKLVQASQYLERPDGLGARQMGATRHLVTRLAVIDERMYVRGTVRHDVSKWERQRGDVHKTVKLGDVWHRAIPNVQLGSWSTGGRVD